MNARALYVVAAIAAVAVALAVIGQRQSAPGDSPSRGLVLPGLADELDALSRVTIVAAGGEPVATLERGAAAWTVAERDAYAADLARLRSALVALSEARIIEPMTDDPSRHGLIGVQDIELESATGTLIRLERADGSSRALILGDSDRDDERFARRPDEAQSFLMDRNPDVPRDAADWAAPQIVDVAGARVQSVTIRHADGEMLTLAKAEPSEPNFTVAEIPDGRELDNPGDTSATGSALRELQLEDVARLEAEPAREPVATAGYATFDGLEIDVSAYDVDGEGWVSISAAAADTADADIRREAEAINERVGGWRYRIPAPRYDRITRRTEDLLAPAD